jgi:hypothetical protein
MPKYWLQNEGMGKFFALLSGRGLTAYKLEQERETERERE